MKPFEATDAATAASWAGCLQDGAEPLCLEGDPNAPVDNAASVDEANERSVLFLREPRPELLKTRTGLLFAPKDLDVSKVPETCRPRCLRRCRFPEASFARFLERAFPPPPTEPGIHPSALVPPDAEIGKNVSIGPGTLLEAGAVIAAGTAIGPNCFIGRGCRVGSGSILYAGVTLYPGVSVGDRCIIHAGTVIGSDGFGYTQDEKGILKVPQVGLVVIEDDVEIGANCTIDRGTVGDTRIGRFVKIDNLVHVAHNCEVGAGTMIAAQAGLAGSTKVGNGVLIGGQVGIARHVTIGDGARIAAQSGVDTNIKPGEAVAGYPARPRWLFWRMMALLERSAKERAKGRRSPGQ